MPTSGWYPDPSGAPNGLRWWDGQRWTEHTRVRDETPARVQASPSSPPPDAHADAAASVWQPRTPRGPRGSIIVVAVIVLATAMVGLLASRFGRTPSRPLDTTPVATGTGLLSPAPVSSHGTPLSLPTASAASVTSDTLCSVGNGLYAPGGKHQLLVHTGVRVTYPNEWNFRIDADQFGWLEDVHPYGSVTRDAATAVIVARQPQALPSDGTLSVQQNYRCWAIAGPIKAAQLNPSPAARPRQITTNGLSGHELRFTQRAASGNDVTTLVRSYVSGTDRVIVIAWTENPTPADQTALTELLDSIAPA